MRNEWNSSRLLVCHIAKVTAIKVSSRPKWDHSTGDGLTMAAALYLSANVFLDKWPYDIYVKMCLQSDNFNNDVSCRTLCGKRQKRKSSERKAKRWQCFGRVANFLCLCLQRLCIYTYVCVYVYIYINDK